MSESLLIRTQQKCPSKKKDFDGWLDWHKKRIERAMADEFVESADLDAIWIKGGRVWYENHKRWTDKVYFVEAPTLGYVKIGVSSWLPGRFKNLKSDCPFPLSMLVNLPGDRSLESAFHRTFSEFRVRGEWFTFSARIRECIAQIKALQFAGLIGEGE